MRKSSTQLHESLLIRGFGLQAPGDEQARYLLDADLYLMANLRTAAVPAIDELYAVITASAGRAKDPMLPTIAAAILDAVMTSYPQCQRIEITVWQDSTERGLAGFKTARDRHVGKSYQGRSIRQPRPR